MQVAALTDAPAITTPAMRATFNPRFRRFPRGRATWVGRLPPAADCAANELVRGRR